MEGVFTVGGLPVLMCHRSFRNDGGYRLVFPHDTALSQIEALDWEHPVVQIIGDPREGYPYLPEGCGFECESISYSSVPRYWTVEIKLGKQYLGDVTGYQAQIDTLEAQAAEKDSAIAEKDAAIAELEADSKAAAEADLQAAYNEGVNSIG